MTSSDLDIALANATQASAAVLAILVDEDEALVTEDNIHHLIELTNLASSVTAVAMIDMFSAVIDLQEQK